MCTKTLNMLELLDIFIQGDIKRLTSIISDKYESFLLFYNLWLVIPTEEVASIICEIDDGFKVIIDLVEPSESIDSIIELLNNTGCISDKTASVSSDNNQLIIDIFTF